MSFTVRVRCGCHGIEGDPACGGRCGHELCYEVWITCPRDWIQQLWYVASRFLSAEDSTNRFPLLAKIANWGTSRGLIYESLNRNLHSEIQTIRQSIASLRLPVLVCDGDRENASVIRFDDSLCPTAVVSEGDFRLILVEDGTIRLVDLATPEELVGDSFAWDRVHNRLISDEGRGGPAGFRPLGATRLEVSWVEGIHEFDYPLEALTRIAEGADRTGNPIDIG